MLNRQHTSPCITHITPLSKGLYENQRIGTKVAEVWLCLANNVGCVGCGESPVVQFRGDLILPDTVWARAHLEFESGTSRPCVTDRFYDWRRTEPINPMCGKLYIGQQ